MHDASATLPANGEPDVSGPVQLSALVRVVARAHAQRNPHLLALALDDVAAAATSWAAQVRRHTAAAALPDPFAIDDAEIEASEDKRSRYHRARVAEREAQRAARTGRSAEVAYADLSAAEALVGVRVLA